MPESKLPPLTGDTWTDRILRVVEPVVFAARVPTHIVLLVITAFLTYQALLTKPDAGWLKSIPIQHPYMQKFIEYFEDFGGANRLIITVMAKDGDIYNAEYLNTFKALNDEIFFTPGVDRLRMLSLFTTNVAYVEVVEGGLKGSPVMPPEYLGGPDFEPPESMIRQIRSNVRKAGIIGQLVADNENGAMITAELLEINPQTGEKLDYIKLANDLEAMRAKYQEMNPNITIHMIGFVKIVGDIVDAIVMVVGFFFIALFLTMLLLWAYTGSFKLSLLPMGCSIIAVIWEFGLLRFFGYGIDPYAILVPFLVLSVSVSHGVQYANAWVAEIDAGRNNYDASLMTFRRLAIPGTAALITDVAGFATIYLIEIQTIQEMSLNAAFGVAAIIITNKMLMPIWLTYLKIGDMAAFREKQIKREHYGAALWQKLSYVTRPSSALVILGISAVCTAWGVWKYPQLMIGDAQEGVPELRPDSRYNLDAKSIVENFDLGTDVMIVIAEMLDYGCVEYAAVDEIDRFQWHMKNTEGVAAVQSIMTAAQLVYSGLNDGRVNSFELPRNKAALGQLYNMVPPSAAMKTVTCDAIAIMIFTEDHKATTIARIVDSVKEFNEKGTGQVHFALASGNVGVMAATNEEVEEEELPVVGYVYLVIVTFLWLSFRSIPMVIAVVAPLSLVSLLSYGLMAQLDIGLKVATLPVVALAAGIGVDYGIYVMSTIKEGLERGLSLRLAFERTMHKTGKAVIFTGISLGGSVATWLFSGLQFQVDMGTLLVFMFTANMFGAILILPALCRFLIPICRAEMFGQRSCIDPEEMEAVKADLRNVRQKLTGDDGDGATGEGKA